MLSIWNPTTAKNGKIFCFQLYSNRRPQFPNVCRLKGAMMQHRGKYTPAKSFMTSCHIRLQGINDFKVLKTSRTSTFPNVVNSGRFCYGSYGQLHRVWSERGGHNQHIKIYTLLLSRLLNKFSNAFMWEQSTRYKVVPPCCRGKGEYLTIYDLNALYFLSVQNLPDFLNFNKLLWVRWRAGRGLEKKGLSQSGCKDPLLSWSYNQH